MTHPTYNTREILENYAAACRRARSLLAPDANPCDHTMPGMPNLHLSYLNLDHCNLRGIYLPSDPLASTSLVGTSLVGTSLVGANLEDAYLPGSWIEFANLQNAVLINAVLRRAYLKGTVLKDAYLDNADFTGATGVDDIPKAPIPGLAARVLKQLEDHPDSWLDLPTHGDDLKVENKHRLAGWAVTLADKVGQDAKDRLGIYEAARRLLGGQGMPVTVDREKAMVWLRERTLEG